MYLQLFINLVFIRHLVPPQADVVYRLLGHAVMLSTQTHNRAVVYVHGIRAVSH